MHNNGKLYPIPIIREVPKEEAPESRLERAEKRGNLAFDSPTSGWIIFGVFGDERKASIKQRA